MKYHSCNVKTSRLLLVTLLPAFAACVFAQSGDVVITTNTTWATGSYQLNSLTVNSGATLTVGGGSTIAVTAGITVTGNSNIVLQSMNNTAQVNGTWQGTGVTINAASVQVDAGSTINADGQGYAPNAGLGGALPGSSAGGSYGGRGATSQSSPTYGSATAPTDLGSGGGNCCGGGGGTGGGAVILTVSGTLTNNGVISANGSDSPGNGGGAGGSVYVRAGALVGAGSFNANGGGDNSSNGGGGGRVAVYYGANSNFTGFAASTASAGIGGSIAATNGSAGFFDTTTPNSNLSIYQNFPIPAGSTVTYTAVTVQSGGMLTVGGGAQVNVTNALTVGGTIIAQSVNNTAQVNGSWQGTGVTINAGSLQVNTNGSFNADGQGYTANAGPGGSLPGRSDGGSYGGLGAGGQAQPTYGSPTAPTDLGSGGGNCCGGGAGSGGGAIRLNISGTLTDNGIISANGSDAPGIGGGAGGSIYVTTGTLAGSGSFSANGGGGSNSNGGGGGRIAIVFTTNNGFNPANATANGGTGTNANLGQNGTVEILGTNGNLTVSDNLVLPANANLSYGSITINNQGSLTLGSGTTLAASSISVSGGGTFVVGGGLNATVLGAITVTGNSNIILQSVNNAAQVNGTWMGAGATISAGSIEVDAGSTINADGQGYVPKAGPGGSLPGRSDGGSYGGQGAGGQAQPTYGSVTAPIDLGSGGGNCCGNGGGAGGGAVRLLVSGTLTNNGVISANGALWEGAGGGAGGSVYVTTGTMVGAGSFNANGAGDINSNGGGGGRVAVYYGANSNFTGFAASTASAGAGGTPAATNGSVGFFDTTAPNSNLSVYQNFPIPSGSTVTYNAIAVQSGGLLTIGGGTQVTVTTAVTVGGTIIAQSVNNTAQVGGGWHGAGVTINAASLQVNASGSLNADGQGYTPNAGPGGSLPGRSDGGSYGGLGAGGQAEPTYGSPTAPTDLGSGGGNCCAHGSGSGGGAIRLLVSGALTNNGVISANGADSPGAGGGAGGSIYVTAGTLASSGSFSANGGGGSNSNGGGGGRVAVYAYTNSGFNPNSLLAAGGQGGSNGSAGTVTFLTEPLLLWLQPTESVLHGIETLQWFANFGATVNVSISGPQSFTIAQGANIDLSSVLDTTTLPNGRYELNLTLLDASGKTLQQQPMTVVINNSVVWHSGTITSNQEWTANQVQVLDGNVIVPSGVTLTIDPGTIVKALPGAEIVVQSGGILNASGSNSFPVIFTTFDDSSVGGNTDFNAGGSLPVPGEWQGISVQAGGQFNSNNNTDLRYVNFTLSGTLSSQTLQSTFVYTVTGTVVVPNGVSLNIQPGTILKFNTNAGISVQPGATLTAIGTVAQPIYFTSIKDDSIGGDTNGDGSATSPAAGDWGSIVIDGAQATFTHVQMLYGSGPASATVMDVIGMIETTDNANVTISDSIIAQGFWNAIQGGYPNGGGDTVTVTNTVIWGMGDRAINAWPNSTVHAVNNTIDGNGTGIFAHGGTVDVANTIVSNSKNPQWGGMLICCGGTFSSLINNDVWTSVAGVPNYVQMPDPTGTNGNISANPVFVNEAQSNFLLNYGSPAIDAANGKVPNYPTTDAVGNARYNDPLVTAKTGVPDAHGNYPDIGAYEFVASAPSNIDLTVPSVTGPTAALVGSTVTINWTVTNIGSGIAYGPWHDAVYLVRDPDTNPVAIFAGQVLEGAGAVLGPGASYSASGTIRVPGTVVGNARWEVKTNVLGEIFEGANSANNTGVSLDNVAVDLPALINNGPAVSNSFAAAGQSWWYKLEPGANQNVGVNLNLTGGGNPGAVQLFIGQGYVPDPQNFDIQQVQFNSPRASAVISNTSSQTYYVTAYAQSLTAAPAPFSLSAATPIFSLTTVQPAIAANSGMATLTFVGGGFTSGATYQLAGPGGTINSSSVFVTDSSHVDVTFAMNGVATGSYAAKVTLNGRTVTLNNAVTVSAGTSGPAGSAPIQVSLSTPEAFRAGFPAQVTLNYQNVSGIDQVAPIIILTAQGATLSDVPPPCSDCDANFALKYQNTYASGEVLGINQQGPAGILPAGASGSIPFQVIPTAIGTDVTFALQLPNDLGTLVIADPSLVIPGGMGYLIATVEELSTQIGPYPSAANYCNSIVPPNITPYGFSRTCMLFLNEAGYAYYTSAIGGITGFIGGVLDVTGVNRVLANDASALSQLGIYESNASRLQAFEYAKDGMSLFNQRYHQGAFGYGTSHAFDITAGLTGTIPTVFYPDGTARSFGTLNPSKSNQYLASVGDYGVLTIEGDGSWLVTENNGVLYHFIVDPLPSVITSHHLLDYIQDLNGNRITVSYGNDLVTTVADNFGNTATFAYDALGHITQSTDPLGRVTTYTYDILQDAQHSTFLTSVTNSAGTTTFSWNEGGSGGVGYFADSCVTTYCEPAIGISTIAYPDGTHTYFTYDAVGRLASQSGDNGAGKLTYTYSNTGSTTVTDALGNAWAIQTGEGGQGQYVDAQMNVTQFSYDPENKLTHILAPMGTSTSLSYDSLDHPTGFRDPSDNQLNMSYGASGNLLSFTDANGNAMNYTYNAGDDPTAFTFPDGSAQQATYDSRGNLLTLTNRRGHTITYTYTAQNLLTSKTFPSGKQVQYTYDNHRNLQSVITSSGTTAYTYDSADRLTRVAYPNGKSVQYSYSAGGQRTSMSDSTGFTVNYSYDSAGRLSQLSNGSSPIASYAYDAAGRLSRKSLGNGTYTTFAYDAAGNLLHLINYTSGSTVLSEYDYTYDGLGRRASMNSPAGAWTYAYDADGQLTTVTMPGGSIQYTYDAAGNRTASVSGSASTFLVNNLNEDTQAGASAYQYDADGNLISGAGWNYTYDDENRLIAATSATDTWSYQYDGLGNRISATHNGTVTQYLNDPTGMGNVEAEFDGNGNLISHYTYGLDLTSSIPAGGSPAYYHFDAAGNTAQMTNAAGSVVNSYTYLPFGEKVGGTTGVTNPFTYVGEFGVMDEGSGLYFMRRRWYNPSLGRFVQTDPAGLAGGDLNFYRYASNSPTNLNDPSGLQAVDTGGSQTDYYTFGGGAGLLFYASVNKYTGELFVGAGAGIGAGGNASAGHVVAPTPANGDRSALTSNQLGGLSTNWSLYSGPGGGWSYSYGDNGQGTSSTESGVGGGGHGFGGTYGVDTGLSVYNRSGSYLIPQAGVASDLFYLGWDAWYNPNNWGTPFGPVGFGRTYFGVNVPVPRPKDPNGKLTTGFGTDGFIPPNTPIAYTVFFENQSSATAPAALVTVTDALPANLDWSTLQLNQIQFNNVTINVPPGLQTYSTKVNVSTDPNPVNVSASLNGGTGVLTWAMQSVDPTTGQLPANPYAGFLPPNNAGNQGTGFVTFTVSPKASLGNAAAITNQASIVFDVNAAIATNSVTNTLDNTTPSSAVSALPATTTATSFTVGWTGSDANGSGIAGYNIFVALDGGSYGTWMTNTTQTSATFTAAAGHSYSFYSLAVSNVGTMQTVPGPAQTIDVVQPSGPGPCTVTNDPNASVADVQQVINEALGLASATNDLNGDKVVNAVDVQIVMNAVIGLGCTT